MLLQTTPKFLYNLSVIWGQEKPQYTALPNNLLASPFLQHNARLPVTEKENPTWFRYLQKSDAKRDEWISRIGAYWSGKLDDQLARNKPASLRSRCGQYRDPNPEMSWRAAHMLIAEEKNIEQIFSNCSDPAKANSKFWHEWRLGTYDAALLPACQAMDVNFKLSDLPCFTSITLGDMCPDRGPLADIDDQRRMQKRQSDYEDLMRQLHLEQSAMQLHRAQCKQAENQSVASAIEYESLIQEQLDEAVSGHVSLAYPLCAADSLQAASVFMANCTPGAAKCRPSVEASQLCYVSLWNLPMLGLKCSNHLTDVINRIETELTSFPSVSCALVFAPNQPRYRDGRQCSGMSEARLDKTFERCAVAITAAAAGVAPLPH